MTEAFIRREPPRSEQIDLFIHNPLPPAKNKLAGGSLS